MSALWRLNPIGLAQLNDRAALQTRVDRKYLLPVADAYALLGQVSADTRALKIDGRRVFAYESVYFDTPDLTSYLLARATRGVARSRSASRTPRPTTARSGRDAGSSTPCSPTGRSRTRRSARRS